MSSDEEFIPFDDGDDSDYVEDTDEDSDVDALKILEDLEDEEWLQDDKPSSTSKTRKKPSHVGTSARKASKEVVPTNVRRKGRDDGDEKHYKKRMKEFNHQRHQEIADHGEDPWTFFEEVDPEFGFKVPTVIWEKLFAYQQACVKWLWELHKSCTGGIIGDEMGLGKTIQVIAFLSGLHSSQVDNFRESFKSLGPSIIVCPATVMHQWVNEINTWFPPLKVAILHSSGSWGSKGKSSLIRSINKNNGILVTTYSCVNDYQEDLSAFDWHYVILDEGHKIRNPDAQTTLACKRFRTPHRIILSGSPIQNNLKELWSLFDFVVPGLLGTLPVFVEQFSIPITQGGYSNASDVQVKIAFKCATVLRDTIRPYLLRRMKDDVKDMIKLPNKNEQVLFCRLTNEQRDLYQRYIDSPEVKDIVRGSNQMFVGLINLRKICNHPSLFDGFKGESNLVKLPVNQRKYKVKPIDPEPCDDSSQMEFHHRSGKMLVIESLLRIWKKQGHKVLLFTQGRKMLHILEKFLYLKDYTFLTLDGSTNISQRQSIINQFNQDKEIFCFLLTTRVGGIGVNLTSASRVLIYDPDWNPSTDMQARERAWRIGQESQVTIYRLLTAGTIEEKMYHRQIFKQYLTNRILKDPKQRRFFKTNDLYELFSLAKDSESTESSAIFAGTGSDVKVERKRKKSRKKDKKKKRKRREEENDEETTSVDLDNISIPPDRVRELRERAKMLSQMLSKKFGQTNDETAQNIAEDASRDLDKKSKDESLPPPTSSGSSSTAEDDKKGIMFEGERISFLVKSDTTTRHADQVLKEAEEKAEVTSSDGSSSDDENSKSRRRSKSKKKKRKENHRLSRKQDEYVLTKLFKNKDSSVIHSALQHDVIEGTNTQLPADYTLVEAEAEKVANDAIKALKRSRSQCFSAVSGVPTWTGLSGKMKKNPTSSDAKASSSKNDQSSSSLLSVMRNRHRLEESSSTTLPSVDTAHDDLLHDLRSFIAFQARTPGEASTQEVLDRFSQRLPSHQTPVFKAFLHKMCDFQRRNGTGVWTLKQDF